MFIIPYGHDDDVTRRFPVVTVGIVVVNVIFFAIIQSRIQKAGRKIPEILGALPPEERGPTPVPPMFDPHNVFIIPTPAQVEARVSKDPPGRTFYNYRSQREEEYSEEAYQQKLAEWKKLRQMVEDYAGYFDVYAKNGAYRGLAQQGGENFRPWMPLTSMFVHFGWMHLIGNFIYLMVAGTKLEDLWGRRNFTILYVLGGLVANFAHVVLGGSGDVPFGGASGAIMALLGAFLVFCFDSQVKFVWFIFLFSVARAGTLMIPAYVVFPLMILGDIYAVIQGWNSAYGSAGIAHWAHIGGFFFGLGAAAAIKGLQLEKKLFPIVDVDARGRVVADSPLAIWKKHDLYDEALEMKSRARCPEAAALFEKMAEDHPTVPGPWEEAAECYRLGRDPERQKHCLLQAVPRALRMKTELESVNLYRKLQDVFPGTLLEAGDQMQMAQIMERRGDYNEAANALRRLLDTGIQGLPAVKALFRYGELCDQRFRQPEVALDAYRQALILAEGDPNWASMIRERMNVLQSARKSGPSKPPPPSAPAGPPPLDPHRRS